MKKKRTKKTGNATSHGETNLSDRAIPVDEAEPAPTENGSPAHPHDRLFKEVFSSQEAQQDLVRMALPPEITTYVFEQVAEQYRQPLLTAIEDAVYTEEEGKRMRSIADSLREEGMVTGLERGISQGLEKGLEQGKADVLVRLLRRRFGLTEEEEAVVRECHDAERLDEAADAFADPEVGKDEVLALLT